MSLGRITPFDRRDFMRGVALAGIAAEAKGDDTARPADTAAAKDVTGKLASFVVASKAEEIPPAVNKDAARTLLNWAACAVGGSRDETVDIAVSALAPFAGSAQATLLGRKERLDVLNAALINGIASHIFDYDDTHLRTVIHPAGPVASAILALSEYRALSEYGPVAGRDFMHALVLGVEVECRIGNAVYPAHYDAGWHITGTAGVFGSAAAVGKLIGLNERQMVWALGLAATQPVGLREMFGTMTKSFHPGRAAQNGLTAAMLASHGFTSSEQPLEAKSGWMNVLSSSRDYTELTRKLGQTYEISLNTYKPFACGVVIHPAIDGCIQLRNQYQLTADQVERIDLRVHPLVLELTGKKTPQTGLEGKFSVYYAAALAIVKGAAGEREFSDGLVRDPSMVALRDRVTATVDPLVGEAQVKIAITLKDGRRLEKSVDKVIGSLENPLTDSAIEAKFLDLSNGILAPARARKTIELCWNAGKLADAGEIARSAGAL
jgi:2-methylcitrate dehydratase PrpD